MKSFTTTINKIMLASLGAILLALLAACSSAPPESLPANNIVPPADLEVRDVDNADFQRAKNVPYRPNQDNFSGLDITTDALARESIARLPEGKLYDLKDSEDLINQILSACYRHDFGRANKMMDEVYQSYRKHPTYYNAVGTCWLLQNKPKKAMLFYNKAREIDPKFAPAYNNMGVIHQKEGKDQSAILAYEEAAKYSSFSRTPNFNLAQIYLHYGMADKAIALAQGIYANNAQDPDVLGILANGYFLQGKIDQALSYFTKIDRRSLRSAHLGLNYAVALKIKGRTAEAEDVFSDIDQKTIVSPRYYRRASKYLGER